jgi:hypothetical protein
MAHFKTRIVIVAAGLAVAAAASSDALAGGFGGGDGGGGGSDYGDSWLNDSVKNPRFIEPYADQDPARYRAYHHREGYYIRQRAARGYDDRGYGRVEVEPFGYYRP